MKEKFVTWLDKPITWRESFKWAGVSLLIWAIWYIIIWLSNLDLKQKKLEKHYAEMTIEPRKEESAQ